MNNYDLGRIKKQLSQRDPDQGEFRQAVLEVFESLEGLFQTEPEYADWGIIQKLIEPERVIQFQVPWLDDNGVLRVNRGFRVQHNSALGPYKGGLRFHPSVNLSVLKFLAFEQTFKNALTGQNLGGGKGGSDFDPRGKSESEVMRFCRSFMSELHRYIGADTDVPAGDIGVGEREIGFMLAEYNRLTGLQDGGVLTGKSLYHGGSQLRTEATGYGLVYLLTEFLESQSDSLEGKRVLVSGSGNVSLYVVEKLIEYKAQPISLSDSSGLLVVNSGIDRELLEEIKDLKFKRRGRLAEFAEREGCEYRENRNPWGLEADIAAPCATQNEIDADDAQKLVDNGVKIVAEGANMPTTAEAVAVFRENDIFYLPGKAANAGGVSVSSLEMAQNAQKTSWTREEVDEKLRGIMRGIHSAIFEVDENPANYDRSANIVAYKRLLNAIRRLGV